MIMKKIIRTIGWSIVMLVLAVQVGTAQSTGSKQDQELISIARKIIRSTPYCALVTIDADNVPRIRPMDPLPPDENMVIWLATNPKSRKVDQINQNPLVVLYYSDPEKPAYVTIQGSAELVNDPEIKRRNWKEAWDPFYKDSETDATLVKITPQWLELISVPDNILGDTISWQPPKVDFGKE